MTTEELIDVLNLLSKEIIDLPCPGCGWEADICVPECCMILREAAEQIETLNTLDNMQSAKLLERNNELERRLDAAMSEIALLLKEAVTNEDD